jgi:hypothetical protein
VGAGVAVGAGVGEGGGVADGGTAVGVEVGGGATTLHPLVKIRMHRVNNDQVIRSVERFIIRSPLLDELGGF